MNQMSKSQFSLEAGVTAEQQLLGAVMMDNTVFDLVSDVLAVEHFVDPVHARIFDICGKRISKGHLASPVAMSGVLGDDLRTQIGGRDPTDERIFIRADRQTRYGDFMQVMNALQDNGFYSVALVGEDNS